MPGNKKVNSDLNIDGKISVSTVPNLGTTATNILTQNSSTKEISKRTGPEIISDFGIASNSWVSSNYIPKTHPVYNITQGLIDYWAFKDGTNATGNWVNTSNGLIANPTIPGKHFNASGNSSLINATYGEGMGYLNNYGLPAGNPSDSWFYRLKFLHNNPGGCYGEFAIQMTDGNSAWYKRYDGGTDYGWIRLLDTINGVTLNTNQTIYAEKRFVGNTFIKQRLAIQNNTTGYDFLVINAGTNKAVLKNPLNGLNETVIFGWDTTSDNYPYINLGQSNARIAVRAWIDTYTDKALAVEGPSYLQSISTQSHGDSSQWNQAYTWGNHATQGYLKSETDTLDSVLSRGNTTTRNINLNSGAGIIGQIADNDFWRIIGLNNGSNQGYLELATGDDGTEPIVARQYLGVFSNIVRQADILDSNGNTKFPGNVVTNGLNFLNARTGQGTTPTISVAIGDNDTGFNWESDGNISYYSNAVNKYSLNDVATQSWVTSNYPNQSLSLGSETEHGQSISLSNGGSGTITNYFVTSRDGPRNVNDASIYPNANPRRVRFDFMNVGQGTGGVGNFMGVMTYSPFDGTTASTGDSSYQLVFINETGINGSGLPGLALRKGIDTTWGSFRQVAFKPTIKTISDSTYTVIPEDANNIIIFTATNVTVTMTASSVNNLGDAVQFEFQGTGSLTVVGSDATILVNQNRAAVSDGQHSTMVVQKLTASSYKIYGEIV